MKNLPYLILIVTGAIFYSCAATQHVSEPSDDASPYSYSPDEKLPVDQKITIGKLDNDLTYYIRENQKPENRMELRLVVKAARGLHQQRKRVFAGVTNGCMAQIKGQSDAFGQIGIKPQHPGDRARNLRHLDRMGQAGAVVIAFVFDKDLRLMLETAKGRRMDDAVTVALKGRTKGRHAFGKEATARGIGLAGKRRKHGTARSC